MSFDVLCEMLHDVTKKPAETHLKTTNMGESKLNEPKTKGKKLLSKDEGPEKTNLIIENKDFNKL